MGIGPAQGRASAATASRAMGRACDSIVYVYVTMCECMYVVGLGLRAQDKLARCKEETSVTEKEKDADEQRAADSFSLSSCSSVPKRGGTCS